MPTPTLNRETLLLLAGGQASRMGGLDKWQLPWQGETLRSRHERAIFPAFQQVLVCSPTPISGLPKNASHFVDPGKGPFVATQRALLEHQLTRAVVLACDMPTPSLAIVRALFDMLHEHGAVAAIAEASGHLHFLHGVYSARLAEDATVTSFRAWREKHRAACQILTAAACQNLDPSGGYARNLNRPSDLG